MKLPETEKNLAEISLAKYCENRIHPHVRDKVKLGFETRGQSFTLFEERPPFDNPRTWVKIVVAQFRYDHRTKRWTLYCADRNSRWHLYDEIEPAKSLQTLLDEVEDDPTGIFWG